MKSVHNIQIKATQYTMQIKWDGMVSVVHIQI